MGDQKLSHVSTILDVGLLKNALAMNEKLLMLVISGGNRFAIETIPDVYRIVVPSSFPFLAMLVWDMVRPLKPCWVLWCKTYIKALQLNFLTSQEVRQ